MRIDPFIDLLAQNGLFPTEIKLNYTVIEGFDSTAGKFANTLGNVAIVDCNGIGINLRRTWT